MALFATAYYEHVVIIIPKGNTSILHSVLRAASVRLPHNCFYNLFRAD